MTVTENKGVYCFSNNGRVLTYIDCCNGLILKGDKTPYPQTTTEYVFLNSNNDCEGKEEDVAFYENLLFLNQYRNITLIKDRFALIEKISKINIRAYNFFETPSFFALFMDNLENNFLDMMKFLRDNEIYVSDWINRNNFIDCPYETFKKMLKFGLAGLDYEESVDYLISILEKNGHELMYVISREGVIKIARETYRMCKKHDLPLPRPSHFYSESLKILDYCSKIEIERQREQEKNLPSSIDCLAGWSYGDYRCVVLKSKLDFITEGVKNKNCMARYYKNSLNKTKAYCSIRHCDNMNAPIISCEIININTTPSIYQFLGKCNAPASNYLDNVQAVKNSLLNFLSKHLQ